MSCQGLSVQSVGGGAQWPGRTMPRGPILGAREAPPGTSPPLTRIMTSTIAVGSILGGWQNSTGTETQSPLERREQQLRTQVSCSSCRCSSGATTRMHGALHAACTHHLGDVGCRPETPRAWKCKKRGLPQEQRKTGSFSRISILQNIFPF